MSPVEIREPVLKAVLRAAAREDALPMPEILANPEVQKYIEEYSERIVREHVYHAAREGYLWERGDTLTKVYITTQAGANQILNK